MILKWFSRWALLYLLGLNLKPAYVTIQSQIHLSFYCFKPRAFSPQQDCGEMEILYHLKLFLSICTPSHVCIWDPLNVFLSWEKKKKKPSCGAGAFSWWPLLSISIYPCFIHCRRRAQVVWILSSWVLTESLTQTCDWDVKSSGSFPLQVFPIPEEPLVMWRSSVCTRKRFSTWASCRTPCKLSFWVTDQNA